MSDFVNRQGYSFRALYALVEKNLVLLSHDTCGAETIDPALRLAEWEADNGIKATYFIWPGLPTYYTDMKLPRAINRIAELGHSIGLHYDVVPALLRHGRAPEDELFGQLTVLRSLAPVSMIAAHGSPDCYTHRYFPYEVFVEFFPERNASGGGGWLKPSASTLELGVTERYLHTVATRYLSDSQGTFRGWKGDPRPRPFERVGGAMVEGTEAIRDLDSDDRVSVLLHPCYWTERK